MSKNFSFFLHVYKLWFWNKEGRKGMILDKKNMIVKITYLFTRMYLSKIIIIFSFSLSRHTLIKMKISLHILAFQNIPRTPGEKKYIYFLSGFFKRLSLFHMSWNWALGHSIFEEVWSITGLNKVPHHINREEFFF